MGARLIPGGPGLGQLQLVLPNGLAERDLVAMVQAATASARLGGQWEGQLAGGAAPALVDLVAGAWLLTLRDLRAMATALTQQGFSLHTISSSNRRTLVAARALGIEARHLDLDTSAEPDSADGPEAAAQAARGLTVHQGTLRSGDHLQVDGSVLVLGDVNPGARISAGGHVLVWGKLRGVAHAGQGGDRDAKIVALQLRPLQLRIAEQVARGPEGLPPEGLAEEARLVDGAIQIDPASPGWPLAT